MEIHYGLILLSLIYTLVTLYFGKGLTKHMEIMCRRGLNPCRSFHSQAVLLLPNNNISIVIGTNSWVSMAICHKGLSSVFTDTTCDLLGGYWLCYLLGEKERKQNALVGFLSHLVCSSRTCPGVCFSLCFAYSEINKSGIKMKSADPNQTTVPISLCITI